MSGTTYKNGVADIVKKTETDLSGMSFFLDEDAMGSDSAVKVASQQSIKKYVDDNVGVSDIGEGHITILGHNYSSIGQGTFIPLAHASQVLDLTYNSSGNNADNISYSVYLAVGTYTLRLLTHKGVGMAITDIDFDGGEIHSEDLYNAIDVWNYIITVTGISVATAGFKVIRVRADGKHASATAYQIHLSAFGLWRTA